MATILLEAHGLSAVTPDGISLFSELDLVLERRVVALVGRNGSGKSTLGRMLAGEQAPDAGVVQRHSRTGWLPQEVLTEPGARVRDVRVARELLALDASAPGSASRRTSTPPMVTGTLWCGWRRGAPSSDSNTFPWMRRLRGAAVVN